MANDFVFDEHDHLYSSNEFTVPEMIIREDDPKLFEQIFGLRCNPLLAAIADYSAFYNKEWFIFDVLNSPLILESLLKIKKYKWNVINERVEPRNGLKPDIELVSPLVNYCLKFALKHLDDCKEQAIKLLKFAIKHNKEMLTKLEEGVRYYVEYGCVLYESFRVCRGSFFEVAELTGDDEINKIINELPKLKK